MTRIDFYFNAPSKIAFACRMARKARSAGSQLVIYGSDAEMLTRLDRELWTFSALDFLPHCYAHEALAAQTPILLASQSCETAHHEVLVNLDRVQPEFFSRFERVIEIVSGDDDDRSAARERWKFYKERGYALDSVDVTGVGT
jgi:DNA polymerase-3 subunit chi